MNKPRNQRRLLRFGLLQMAASLLIVSVTLASSSTNYAINFSQIGAGGGENSASTNYHLSSSVGQPIAGNVGSSNYRAHIGYRQAFGATTPHPTVTPGGPTNTPIPTSTPLPSATPTSTPAAGQWSPYPPPIFEPNIRGSAQAFSNTLYLVGGRPNDFNLRANVYYRNINSGAWLVSDANFPTPNNMSNLITAVLTDSSGVHIVALGGSSPGTQGEGGRIYVFTPGSPDTIVELTNDRWPARTGDNRPVVASGGAVVGNKWYVFGGIHLYDDGTIFVDNRTWVFDLSAPDGQRWTQITGANLNVPRGYIGGIAVDGKLYAVGFNGDGGSGNFTDITATERLDPLVVSPTWQLLAPLPTGRGGLAAYGFNTGTGTQIDGKIVTAGGNFNTPDNLGYIYDPTANTWQPYANLITARRNFGYTQYNGVLYSIGGIGADGSYLASAEQLLAIPRPTATPQPSATPATTVTPTDCANLFTDITGNTFYVAIHYLNCRGVINGLDPTHFGPSGTSTRGQFAKVVVLGFGIPFYTPSGSPDFLDVPSSYFAFLYIESGFHAGILSGFDLATCQAYGFNGACYLPNIPITRGQLTKLVVNAAHYTLVTPGTQTFTDVPPSNVFYIAIETAHAHGVINGYPDGTFRPSNNIRRDEMAQIVYTGIINRPH